MSERSKMHAWEYQRGDSAPGPDWELHEIIVGPNGKEYRFWRRPVRR